MLSFEEIEHTADRAFRAKGRDLASLLKNAARAIRALEGMTSAGRQSAAQDIEVVAIDRESLLVNWLNEILYLEQTQHLVCLHFDIYQLKKYHLRARVETRECDRSHTSIKAVTFHNLKIRETPAGLEAEVVVDV